MGYALYDVHWHGSVWTGIFFQQTFYIHLCNDVADRLLYRHTLWMVLFYGFVEFNTNIGSYVDSFRVPHWQIYDFRRVFLCLGHASVLMLIFRSRIVPWLMKALANVGQMAFTQLSCTKYHLHLVLLWLWF